MSYIMMSQLSSKSMNQVEEDAVQRKSKKPEWVEFFLTRTFFDPCSTHPVRRNETNRYCINCNLAACQYCISAGNHRHHKVLKIYRHVYRDVVSLGALEKYVDCSLIQAPGSRRRYVPIDPFTVMDPKNTLARNYT
ncbi:hypothetical protein Tsubulata_010375 [Turnera subulata]|uniref:B box-type domain-containing protein n=1 Tax=Turnera subulata TaxID=218843 RepID=A0A9Q0G021_9ROSI|nr:hypothetical protein Tsubulata_010375 [Turnera subulata]